LSFTPVQEALLEQFGPEIVLLPGPELHRLLANTSHFAPPQVAGRLRPRSQEQLDELLSFCRRHQAPVYTYSGGLNWGLGSRLPVQPGCFLLDLGSLNRILEINTELRFAVVEPGVTQGMLSRVLTEQKLPLMVNVTGSHPNASLMGNMLERGSGFLAHRLRDIRGLEVLLADGTRVRSGFWNLEEGARAVHHFPAGIGPDWTGLFCQSNLGIVTRAVVSLYPRKEVQKMLWFKVDQARLPRLTEVLADMYQRQYLFSVTHLGNDKRMKIENRNAGVPTLWTGMALVQGSAAFVSFLESEIPRFLEPLCTSMGFLDEAQAREADLAEVFGCHTGVPTDYFVRAMYESEGASLDPDNWQIDYGKYGMLCCLPVLPSGEGNIGAALEILESIERDFGIFPAATLNPMDDLCLEAVINIYFDREDSEAVEMAHRANNEMIRRFYESGFRFYRFDVQVMSQYLDADNPHWQLTARLKKALDPGGLLSPGRYEVAVKS
jgi:4-cresol dehydrogenase (hydroxylating)